MPIVYILTNEAMPNLIKIGRTNDSHLKVHINQLDTTGVPLPFECFYAVKVQNAFAVEKKLHQDLDEYRVRDSREFFKTTPEQAKALLSMAEVMGGVEVTPKDSMITYQIDTQMPEKSYKRRGPFKFDMLCIEPGEKLQFKKDHSIECEVVNERQVLFRGEIMSLSRSAHMVLKEMGQDWSTAGPSYWCYYGETLYELRLQQEHKGL